MRAQFYFVQCSLGKVCLGDIVQSYNFTTVLLGHRAPDGAFVYTYPKRTIGKVDFGLIGTDASGNDLYTNLLRLTTDRCSVNTSYPTP
jgi:hypothetical protein